MELLKFPKKKIYGKQRDGSEVVRCHKKFIEQIGLIQEETGYSKLYITECFADFLKDKIEFI